MLNCLAQEKSSKMSFLSRCFFVNFHIDVGYPLTFEKHFKNYNITSQARPIQIGWVEDVFQLHSVN